MTTSLYISTASLLMFIVTWSWHANNRLGIVVIVLGDSASICMECTQKVAPTACKYISTEVMTRRVMTWPISQWKIPRSSRFIGWEGWYSRGKVKVWWIGNSMSMITILSKWNLNLFYFIHILFLSLEHTVDLSWVSPDCHKLHVGFLPSCI